LLSNIGARVAALVSLSLATFLVARVGGPAGVGIYALLRVVPGLVGVVTAAGLPGAVAYFLSGPARDDRRLPATIVATALAGGLAGTLIWFAAAPAAEGVLLPGLSTGLVLLGGVTVLSQLLVATAKSCSQGTDDMRGANVVIVNEELMFLPVYGLLVLAGVHGNGAVVAGLLLADVATFVPAWVRLARRGFFRGAQRPSTALARDLCSYGLRGQVGGVVTLLNLRLDFMILSVLSGPAVLGIYAIASKFAELLKIPALALSYVLYPEYARIAPAAAAARARRQMREAGLAVAAAAVPLWLVAGPLIPAIYGRDFSGAVVVTAYLYGTGRPGQNSWGVTVGLVLTVALDFALIPSFGAKGAAVASAVAYLASALALVWLFRRSAEPPQRRPADPRRRERRAARKAQERAAVLRLCLAIAVGGGIWLATADGSASPAPRTPLQYRYLIDSGSGQAAAAANGWNLLDVGSRAEADTLPKGTRGLVWVGDYDNNTCTWQVSNAEIARRLAGAARDPKVAGVFFSDEPDPYACPDAPAQHRARSRFIHSLDPRAFTILLADSNSGKQTLSQLHLWRGAADYVALDPYPCYRGAACRYGWIASVIRAADEARLHYWGVAQAFADDTWRWPTPAEERHMLAQWQASAAVGSMTFSWEWAGHSLRSQPALLRVLRQWNTGTRFATAARSLAASSRADEIHYTYTGPSSVAFDWRGGGATIRYGRTRRYGRTAVGRPPTPEPFSSAGPFREARLDGLAPGTTYHYSIGGGPDHTFATAPTGPFRFDAEGDVGAVSDFHHLATTQRQVAGDRPAFVLMVGDLTYGNDEGQASVDRHFDDVMAWSMRAAYMPAWGNHEWDKSTDDLRNYKGRFAIPHGAASPGAPAAGCCGEDWGWFDAGGVRFISYPEPYSDATWPDWQAKAGRVMAAAQADPAVHFIVTFGHRPAYSTGYHPGDPELASILDGFGDRFSKYVLNINGHSHDYERFRPIHHVVHITAGDSGSLETPWSGTDPRTAKRAMHLGHLRIQVTAKALTVQMICGEASSEDTTSCPTGSVFDSTTILARR
jgi:O-antigen/teichoic acid export membrane protein